MLLGGCAQIHLHKGVVLDSQLASGIQPGVDNKDSVEKTLGRPSFTGQFTPNDWYYVSRDVNQVAFRNPQVRQQTVLLVRFDQKGNVASVQRTGQELVMNVKPTGKQTRAWPQPQLLRGVVQQYRQRRRAGPAGRAAARPSSRPRFRLAAFRLSVAHDRDARRHDLCRISEARPSCRPSSRGRTITTRCCSSSSTRPRSCG